MVVANREITKSGYVYIYVSNESKDFKVYFAVSRKTKWFGNNLKITHVRGPLLSEEGYYPFGMSMSAISSTAGTVAKNNYKFNAGTELTESFDINYYETYFRQYDAQLGRFTGVDALAEQTLSWSPYQFGYNNPAMFNDPTGLQADYSDFWNEILSFIGDPNYPNGITFTNKDGKFYGTPYDSEADAVLDGINLIERTGGWGKAGVKYKSYAEAVNGFSARFGYLPPITVKAHNQRDMYGHSWLVVSNWDDVYKQLERNGFRKSPGMLNWDGALFRYLVPDFVSIGGGFMGIVAVGAGSSAELQWVLHGPQASWKPMITATQSVGGGYSVDATINIGTSRYTGNASDISRGMVQTNTFTGDYPGVFLSGGASFLGKVGLTGTVTPLVGTNQFILGGQTNIGLGLPLGPIPANGSIGASNSWIIHDYGKK